MLLDIIPEFVSNLINCLVSLNEFVSYSLKPVENGEQVEAINHYYHDFGIHPILLGTYDDDDLEEIDLSVTSHFIDHIPFDEDIFSFVSVKK